MLENRQYNTWQYFLKSCISTIGHDYFRMVTLEGFALLLFLCSFLCISETLISRFDFDSRLLKTNICQYLSLSNLHPRNYTDKNSNKIILKNYFTIKHFWKYLIKSEQILVTVSIITEKVKYCLSSLWNQETSNENYLL